MPLPPTAARTGPVSRRAPAGPSCRSAGRASTAFTSASPAPPGETPPLVFALVRNNQNGGPARKPVTRWVCATAGDLHLATRGHPSRGPCDLTPQDSRLLGGARRAFVCCTETRCRRLGGPLVRADVPPRNGGFCFPSNRSIFPFMLSLSKHELVEAWTFLVAHTSLSRGKEDRSWPRLIGAIIAPGERPAPRRKSFLRSTRWRPPRRWMPGRQP